MSGDRDHHDHRGRHDLFRHHGQNDLFRHHGQNDHELQKEHFHGSHVR